jgi:UDP-glucose 6-dehydrogenase
MANTYFATKVLFCNEFFDIAKALGVPYEELREVWLEDPRISGDHTRVYPENRGFGGRCLPKDLGAIIARAEEAGCPPRLLKAVQEINAQVRSGADRPPTALR